MKNKIKKLLAAAFSFIFAFSLSVGVSAAQKEESFGFTVWIDTEIGRFSYRIDWWQPEVPEENIYYISLPARAQNSEVAPVIKGADTAVFDGKEIADGEKISSPATGTYTLVLNSTQYTVHILYGSDIPALYIDTQSGNMDAVYAAKSHKEPGAITVLNGDKVEYNGDLEYIKGRGNSTWDQVKKPFNIKLAEKADLFGMGEAKNWSLLANYADTSLLKNKVAVDFADTVGLNFSSKSEIVDLYINNEYIGNYTLIERIEIGENRVDITDLEKLTEEANPGINIEDCSPGGIRGEGSQHVYGGYKFVNIPRDPPPVYITGGYLLEYEVNYRYDDEVSGFVSDYGQAVNLKSPEYASKAQVEYIRDYYQQFEDAVISDDGYNDLGKHYSDYIDMDSMVRMYLFQEYVKNLDAGIASFYYYKDTDGKLVAGPVWDFDKALGVAYKFGSHELGDPNGYYATGGRNNDNDGYTILSLLARRTEFRRLAAEEWENNFEPKIENLIQYVDDLDSKVSQSAYVDKCKWTEGFARSLGDVRQWRANTVADLKNFISERAKFMSKSFNTKDCYLSYYANGGDGVYLEEEDFSAGDKIELKDNKFDYGKREFLGWNTSPDGSGASYMPGDELVIEEDTVLYAQWSKLSFFEKISEFFSVIFNK